MFEQVAGGPPSVSAGTYWLLKKKTQYDGSAEVSRVERDYVHLPITNQLGWEEIKEERLFQDGREYRTVYDYSGDNFADYHRPNRITEFGHLARETTRAFDYDFGPYIVDRTKSVTVSVGGEAFTTSNEYENETGFLQEQRVNGVLTRFGRDAFGNLARVLDANGHERTFTHQWGVVGNQTTEEFDIARAINPDGTIGRETRGGFTTQFGYDELGRLTSASKPGSADTTTEYETDGGTSVTVRRGASAEVTYVDGYGRTTGARNAEQVQTKVVYDELGLKRFQSYPFDQSEGSASHGDTLEYDALGRIRRVTHPDQSRSFVQYLYHDGDVTMTDELGRTTTQRWRAFGNPSESRLLSLRDADQKEWTYEYNALGSLTRLLGPEGMERRWSYDGRNWLRSQTHPESGTTVYDHDPAGNITLKRVGGREVAYRYDGNDRLTRVDAPDGADDIDIDYDAFDHRTRVANGAVESFFDYFNNRLDRRRDVIGGRTFATSFDYDSRDNLERIDYHSGRYVIYDYDHADRIVTVRGSNGAGGEQVFAADVDYHPSGAIKSYTFGNGRQETLSFDDRFRPDHLQSGPLDLIYDFDRAGNVETIIDPRPGFTSSFQYDPLDRLTTVTGFGARSFTYDALGNRRSKSTSSGHLEYFYDAHQRLERIDGPVEGGNFCTTPSAT